MPELDVLAELERWAAENHHHHGGCEGNDRCCQDSGKPYVNSLELVRKIRELRARMN